MRILLLMVLWYTLSGLVLAETSGFELEQLKPGVYLVKDELLTEDYGRVVCNGLLYVVGDEALVIDTPHTVKLSRELIERVKTEFGARVVGVVIGHTHVDSMGGLAAFQELGIPSYSSLTTQEKATKLDLPIPAAAYETGLGLRVGGKEVRCGYFGPGHTVDNAVTYLVEEKVLFGDCLLRAAGAGKGYLDEADVGQWAQTVQMVKEAFPKTEIVVPGHGAVGGPDLLDYTIELFRPTQDPTKLSQP